MLKGGFLLRWERLFDLAVAVIIRATFGLLMHSFVDSIMLHLFEPSFGSCFHVKNIAGVWNGVALVAS